MYLYEVLLKYTLCTTVVYLSNKKMFKFGHAALLPELTNGTDAMELRVVGDVIDYCLVYLMYPCVYFVVYM
jgi:hypothetical protein